MDKRADGESGLIRCLQAVDMALESIAGDHCFPVITDET